MIISGHGVQFVGWWWMCVCELVEKQIKNKKQNKQTST
jgi:hypothetical protein